MEIKAAGDIILHGPAQDILLLIVVVRGTDDLLRKIKLLIVVVLALKRNLISCLAAAQKGGKTAIETNVSSLDLEPFRAQTRSPEKTG